VRDAALELRAGELVGLIGRSGSGKTTLMNVIAGWERLDTGTVDVLGRNPMAETPSWDQVAVLPQRLGLIDELTIRENVEYPARLRGSLDETGERIDELIEGLGLATLQARYPKEVSVGEQQRAALARALVLSPRLLLPDEPTGHQDAGWAARVFQVMRSAVDDGTSCLAATHDEHILPYLDRVLTMSDGEVSEATG
jgi:putative ABC transport system ATP-binding protein